MHFLRLIREYVSLSFLVPAFEFRFGFFRLGLLFQLSFVSQKVHERTGIGSKSTLSFMRGRSCNAKLLEQRLLRVDDTSSFGDMVREEA
jgi:hypothetical protein